MDGFFDCGGGGGGMTPPFLHEPGESPLSDVLDLDQSEVLPRDPLWSGESSLLVPFMPGVWTDMGRVLPGPPLPRSGVRARVPVSSRVSSSEKSVEPSSWDRFQSMLTFSNMIFFRSRAWRSWDKTAELDS